ncbi:MAG TPA: single-stranded-DNA-specific exonuclease RecJ [Flavobacteriales bacterium]|nr:single-stranded-DNA-specific exonuclease RecJ [Flavobacteriales bacterium]
MSATTKRWRLKPPADPAAVAALTHGRSPRSLATLLAQRGIRTAIEARDFYRPSMAHLHDPFLMKDMEQAVERIEAALEGGETIMVYGDYDVDGTTSVALVYSLLEPHAKRIHHYVPDRYSEGYGISILGINRAKELGVTLIIALDCGIKAIDQVAYAKEKGIDFIICDHHTPGERLPEAVAVLDPKRKDCNYPYKELSGCGIGFKLMQAFAARKEIPFSEIEGALDLVAISIGCDIVPITGENRTLAYFGLQRLNEHEARPGIKALLSFSNHKRPLTVTDLVFVLGPRINAAGRIQHGQQAVELLLAKDEKEADHIANLVDANNKERQVLDKGITDAALAMFDSEEYLQGAWSTVVFNPEWHKGVIGIVASRLIERHYRPTVVLTKSNDLVSGSARSVKGFNIYEALDACSDLLERYGGHMYAAGLTMKPEMVEGFRDRFEKVVRETMDESLRMPEEEVDLEIGLGEIQEPFFRALQGMEPFGPENMKPVFLARGVTARDVRLLGNDGTHLKFKVTAPNMPEQDLDAIAFGQADHLEMVVGNQPFSMLFTIEENHWNGRVKLQLNVKDIKPGTENLLVNEPAPDMESTSA